MKKIIVFGGTFNPVHEEHLNMSRAALRELGADKLIIVPTFLPPHKNVVPASAEDRLNMLKIAFRGEEKVEISDYELREKGKSYFYKTAEYFAEKYKDCERYFLIGGDMLADFKTWKNPERILAVFKPVAVHREDCFSDDMKETEYIRSRFGADVKVLDFSGKAISSTEIRTYLAFGLKPVGVSEEVFGYAVSRGVYAPDKYQKYILEKLPIKRVVHTANVVVAAMNKAKELGLDYEKVRIAATLHDCAKYDDPELYKDFTMPEDLPSPVVHASLGAFVAEKVLGVTDAEILDAISYHTSGKPNMTALGKLIFTADMVEKGRTYDGVEELRAAFEKDPEKGFRLCLKEEVLHLLNKKERIYKATLDAYEYYEKN